MFACTMYRTKFYCFVFALCATLVASQSTATNMTIPLNKMRTFMNKELYGDFVHLNESSTVQVNLVDVNSDVAFIIFQVHSHLYNATLYTSSMALYGTSLTGTNIGLYNTTEKGLDTFYVTNSYDFELKLFISIHGYSSDDPIPGGCNMEFPIPISPFMEAITYNQTYIDVKAASPQLRTPYDTNCFKIPWIKVQFYIMYLPEFNFEPDVYFETIRKMITLENIIQYGREINFIARYSKMRRKLSAYPGTGAIYVAVATNVVGNNYSIYVPTHSYACSPLADNDCQLLKDSLSMLISASLFFLGIFICYFGHRFFKTQIMAIGFLTGLVVTYILLRLMFDMDHPALLTASAVSGLCIGSLIVVCWWIFGIPVFVIFLSFADIGFLFASLIYYVSPDRVLTDLQKDTNFWSLFILIMLLMTIALLPISYLANLMCCAMVGAYTAIYPLDYYMGSNMKYILNNVVRRATVTDFNLVLPVPTFQWKDWLLTFLWLGLSASGFWFQYYRNKGKPPFPPPPRSVRAVPEEPVTFSEPSRFRQPNIEPFGSDPGCYDERTPLLA